MGTVPMGPIVTLMDSHFHQPPSGALMRDHPISCICTKKLHTMRNTTMARVRKGRRRDRESGYIVTWDVDSRDRGTAARVYRFIFGDVTTPNGKTYRYPGFVQREGVRYLGQSVLFVPPKLLAELDGFLSSFRVDHEVTQATIG